MSVGRDGDAGDENDDDDADDDNDDVVDDADVGDSTIGRLADDAVKPRRLDVMVRGMNSIFVGSRGDGSATDDVDRINCVVDIDFVISFICSGLCVCRPYSRDDVSWSVSVLRPSLSDTLFRLVSLADSSCSCCATLSDSCIIGRSDLIGDMPLLSFNQ